VIETEPCTSRTPELPVTERGVGARFTPFAAACVLCSILFLLLLISGCALRVSSLRPSGLLPIELYTVVLNFHGALTLAFANGCQLASLAAVVPLEANQHMSRRMLSGAVWLFALQAMILASYSVLWQPDQAGYAGLIPSLPLAGLLAWGALRWRQIGFAASVVLALSALTMLSGLPSEELLFLLCAVALRSGHTRARDVHTTPDAEQPIATSVLIVVNALLAFRTLSPQPVIPLLAVLRFCAGAWLIVRLWRNTAELVASSTVRLAARSGLALMVPHLLLRLTLQAQDNPPFVYDTLYVVAAYHAAILATVFLLLAVGLREFRSEPSLRWANRWLRRGSIAWLLGSLSFVLSMAELGMHGMPRRYGGYLERFTTWQLVTSCSAMLLGIGALVTAATLASGRSRSERTHC
jgi:hypothetical protein